MSENIPGIIAFIREADRLKSVLRKTSLMDGSRRENTAEHTWHLMLMALVLERYANDAIDLFKTLKMLLIHDLAEIGVGDVFVYDEKGRAAAQAAERKAAETMFSGLPAETGAELLALWREFDEGHTPEARFARAVDRLQPVLSNLANDGGTWRELSVPYETVCKKNEAEVSRGSETLWAWLSAELEQARKICFQTAPQ